MATDEMVTVPDAAETDTGGRPGLLGSWWAIALTAVALGLSLAWRFLAGPSPSAPTPAPRGGRGPVARVAFPRRSEPVGPHPRPRLVHVARPGDLGRQPQPGRPGLGPQRIVRGRLPRQRSGVRGAAAARRGHRPVHLLDAVHDRDPGV